MDWNLKINHENVSWKIADHVAVVPSPATPPPGPETPQEIESARTIFGEEVEDSYPGQRDRLTFERAGWQFVDPSESPQSFDMVDSPSPDNTLTRQVFTTENGDVLIETDVATVQLNAAPKTQQRTLERVLAEDGLKILHKLEFAPDLYVVQLPAGRPLPETINALQAKPDRYVFAEPSMLQRISGRQAPNDPLFGQQWQHSNNFGLHSIAAWEITKGLGPQRPVRIAIIDNGMEITHDDLKTAIVGGGYFKRNGQGTATSTFVRYQPNMHDFPVFGHGTFCMGMAGARDNNEKGGCGIAPKSDLLAIACAIDQTGSQVTLARAIDFAVNPKRVDPTGPVALGADVISCSLGTANVLETVLELAINSAASGRGGLGVPIFWAVRNSNSEIDTDKLCSLPNVIAVGRSGPDGKPFKCGHGPKLEFIAPGLDVWGPTWGNGNVQWSGTSFATPLAAGVAALVMSRHPEWTAQQVLQRLRDTCDRANGVVRDDFSGFGRVNAQRAVQ